MIMRAKVLFCFSWLLLCAGCISEEEKLGRGFRYSHGGNYYGTNPSISTDGQKIAFGSIRFGLGDVFIINTDGSNLKKLTVAPEYEGEPRFSPDGTKIVFVSERDDGNTGHVYLMNVDGSKQTRVTNSKYYDSSPSFSPDGKKIVFNRLLSKVHYEIFTINTDGSNEVRVAPNERATYPTFSSDEGKIYYLDGKNTNVSEVWAMNVNGTEKKFIMKMPEKCGPPAFSSDCRKVAFVNAKDINYQDEAKSKTEIWIMNIDGSEQKQITFTKCYKDSPSFFPDSKKILFFEPEKNGRGKGEICIINIDGSDLKKITNNY